MKSTKTVLPLAGNIRYLRHRTGLSRITLAERTGLRRSNIASYENGTAEPCFSDLAELSRCFGVTVEALILQDLKAAYSNSITARTHTAERSHSLDPVRKKQEQRLRGLIQKLQTATGVAPERLPRGQAITVDFDQVVSMMSTLARTNQDVMSARGHLTDPA